MQMKNMRATLVGGGLYVLESDCRANVNEALASKKPLLARIAELEAVNGDLLNALRETEAHLLKALAVQGK